MKNIINPNIYKNGDAYEFEKIILLHLLWF